MSEDFAQSKLRPWRTRSTAALVAGPLLAGLLLTGLGATLTTGVLRYAQEKQTAVEKARILARHRAELVVKHNCLVADVHEGEAVLFRCGRGDAERFLSEAQLLAESLPKTPAR